MDEQEKPPLGLYAYEEIAKSLHGVDEEYWAQLDEMKVKGPFASGPAQNSRPAPPRLPEHLRATLMAYARRLFLVEANEYPASPQIERWFTKLAERVTERVMRAVEYIDQPSFLGTILKAKQIYGLSYHGLTDLQIRQAIGSALDEIRTMSLARFQSVLNKATSNPETATAEGLHRSALRMPKPNGESDNAAESPAGIIERRRKMLSDYKAATGNPSEQRIYKASNSGIHKPEFLKWKDGRLPEGSKTTKRFEQFLKAKKSPIPRKPTS